MIITIEFSLFELVKTLSSTLNRDKCDVFPVQYRTNKHQHLIQNI